MSAYSVSEPFLQFVERDGQPLEDGYVYIGVAGMNPETNPINVYVDEALTTIIAQPIRTLDGTPVNVQTPTPLYVNASDYSITLKDKNGQLVVTSLNNQVRIPFDNTTGNITANRVVFTQVGAGAVTRTVQSRLEDSVSVFDFLAPDEIADVQAGTLLFDVTTGVQNAVSAGKEVYFPAGTYKITSPITIGILVSKTLRGASAGTSIIYNAGAGVGLDLSGNPIGQNYDVTVSDLRVQGLAGGTNIKADWCVNVNFERVDSFNSPVDGISIANSSDVALRSVRCVLSTGVGLVLGQNTNACVVESCRFGYSTLDNVWIADQGGTRPKNHTLVGCSFIGANRYDVQITNADDCRIIGCSFKADANTLRHVSIDGATSPCLHTTIESSNFESPGGASTLASIYVDRAEDTNVIACTIDAPAGGMAWHLTANALRTRLISTNKVVGAPTTDLSSSTTLLVPDGSIYVMRRSPTWTATNIFEFGSGELQMNVDGYTDAVHTKVLNFGGTDYVIFQIGTTRFWYNSGNLRFKQAADPTTSTDGFPVGPGVDSYAFATLPVFPALSGIGFMAWCTDISLPLAPGWGVVPTAGGGLQKRLLLWNGVQWTVIGT